MKHLIRLSMAVICLVLTSNQLHSQVSFGPKVGVNFSTMTLKTGGVAIDPNNMTGFQAGIIAEIGMGKNLVLQPGFLFSTKGSKYSISTLNADFEIKPNYLEIPVNVAFKIGAGPVNIMLMAGPYFAYGIGGSYKVSSPQVGEINDAIKFGSGEDNDLKPFDIGVNFGGGIELSHFQLTAQYGLGLANLVPVTDNDAEQKNKVITISLAYLFGLK
jgi:hypothetical protein